MCVVEMYVPTYSDCMWLPTVIEAVNIMCCELVYGPYQWTDGFIHVAFLVFFSMMVLKLSSYIRAEVGIDDVSGFLADFMLV
ncbi:hypothetical protein GDO81_006707 [Engystomops pustulosus]|uniref:Uncharacterized protein n=1 Tax=Engystomops pustulosus TaxID=76066 RepID=A0AAV7D023_ENGPU|nr:hypothetical protein GDO81_006707 [Engystomops pustulosus]